MNKAVLMSVHPNWIELMDRGIKRIEVRKRPCSIKPPFKVYVYQTVRDSGAPSDRDGKVVAEFTCDYIISGYHPYNKLIPDSCLSREELINYGNYRELYGWHITDWVFYKEPKPLSDFVLYNSGEHPARPPQSYAFVEELD